MTRAKGRRSLAHREFTKYYSRMKTRVPLRVLLATLMTLALLPLLSSVSPGSLPTATAGSVDQVWYQSVGRASADAPCQKSSTTELAAGWTQWGRSWAKWVNKNTGGFVCDRQITWAFGSGSSSGSSSVACATGGGAAGTCVVGATGPGGGIVFYVNESNATGSRYLEAAPSGWNTGSDPSLDWGVNTGGVNCSTLDITGATGTAVGTGLANTTAITAACTTAAQAPAAWAAKNYTGGGVSWFLPSLDELNQLCRYASSQAFDATAITCTGSLAPVGGFTSVTYWSSSQFDNEYALKQSFNHGSVDDDDKDTAYRMRPVRAF